jgi:hypothetical protein
MTLESERQFISRCMGDETMVNDYPDTPQRAAVCYVSWNEAKKKPKVNQPNQQPKPNK